MTHDVERFLTAQASVYEDAKAELRRGRKSGHWMWFIFPQLAGLGRSEMSRFYAISDLDEAKAYLAHADLGARLRECAEAVLANDDRTAEETPRRRPRPADSAFDALMVVKNCFQQ